MSGRGRPSKLTPEVQAKICDALRVGNHRETAAAFAGVDKATLHRWLRRGAKSTSGPYRAFADAINKAFADSEARDVALIGKAANEGSWQAAAWRLERKFPERWGRHDRHEMEAKIDSTQNVHPSEEVLEVLRRIAGPPQSPKPEAEPEKPLSGLPNAGWRGGSVRSS